MDEREPEVVFPRCPGDSPACLGMLEYDCCGTQGLIERLDKEMEKQEKASPTERKRKNLSLPKPSKKLALSPSSRFNTTTDVEVAEASKGFIPTNTAKSTGWALNTFTTWAKQRNARCGDQDKENACPVDLLEKKYSPDIVCSSLQRFIMEARRTDGSKYPAKTLYSILCGLLRYSRQVQPDPVNFLDRKDSRFKKLHGTCDVVFRKLQQDGIGAAKKSSQVIEVAEEDILWQKGVLNTKTPIGLQRAVFFYVGKVCCLRGGEEQRNLKLSQFTRCSDPEEHYVYTEHGSKNRNGGFYQLGVENKRVPIYRNKDVGERCLVSLLDLYIAKLPDEAKEADVFYCRPLQTFSGSKHWYSRQPRGKHTLNDMVKTMCAEAGIEGHFTNHSLRATGATQLFEKNVPEKIIQEFTGHRSVKGLRQYEKVAVKQKQAACKILTAPGTSGSFTQEVAEAGTIQNSAQFPFQMPTFSPVINSRGNVNFTVNICPSGPISVGSTSGESESTYETLLEGVQLEDLM